MCRLRVSTGLRPRCSRSCTCKRQSPKRGDHEQNSSVRPAATPLRGSAVRCSRPIQRNLGTLAFAVAGPQRPRLARLEGAPIAPAPCACGREPGLPAGWHVAGGVLSKEGPVDDLVTNESFGNFELELEWKIGKGGNSGIFYRGTRDYDHVYWSG